MNKITRTIPINIYEVTVKVDGAFSKFEIDTVGKKSVKVLKAIADTTAKTMYPTCDSLKVLDIELHETIGRKYEMSIDKFVKEAIIVNELV